MFIHSFSWQEHKAVIHFERNLEFTAQISGSDSVSCWDFSSLPARQNVLLDYLLLSILHFVFLCIQIYYLFTKKFKYIFAINVAEKG